VGTRVRALGFFLPQCPGLGIVRTMSIIPSISDHFNEYLIGGASLITMLSIFASKALGRFAIPSLIAFLGIGMLAGSEGLGGIYFDNAWAAQFVGLVALAFIIFTGGFHTEWKQIRGLLKEGTVLSTIGVVLTAVMIGGFSSYLLKIPLPIGMLLGAIVSSTDAAAVFSVLRSRSIRLRGDMLALLEFESASNDPVAVLLTIGIIHYVMSEQATHQELVFMITQQIMVGLAAGYALGRLASLVMERMTLEYKGLYPVLLMSFVCLGYAITDVLGGSGFLAVYIMGICMGRTRFVHKASLQDFFDGLSWLSQIAMFVVLGLLVFPSRLITVWSSGLIIAFFIMFVARPASVFLTMLPFRMGIREKTLISWVGLRGSVPIVLATFPVVAGVPHAGKIFDIVFFIVLVSIAVQGVSIPWVTRWLGLESQDEYVV